MIKDREALDLPDYLHVLTGHYVKDQDYRSFRQNGTDDWLLIGTIDGAGHFRSRGEGFIVGQGTLALIRSGAVHDYRTAPGYDRWELLWAHFHPRLHWHDWLAWPDNHGGVMSLQVPDNDWPAILDCFRRAHNYTNAVAPHSRDLAMNALEELILRCHGMILDRTARIDPRIDALLQHINGHLGEEINIPVLAEMIHLSPSRLSHLFQDQVGIPPMQYLDLQRIERAKHLLLRTANGVGAIAEEIGLDPVYFSLRFKQHTGLSPRAYRSSKVTG